MNKQQGNKQQTYIFQVEIMVEDEHHSTALEQLIQGLNRGGWADYRISSGMQLGKLMAQRRAQSSGTPTPVPVSPEKEKTSPNPESAAETGHPGLEEIRAFMKNNSLIRLIVNRGLGVKLNIPCRIINIDENANVMTVYHVDEKQVYSFRLNEIEDFIG
ncbi:hypothetical protein [Paenibacillus soyae]|uniref:Uncharacterized protein n=1 Tax=Paenibacillus soyae TaxID=2969249 RepID=A0A9X2SB33_9BACL|nr:hypothetical protein [Paenibacillus soyae]MCR2804367.1 hypothetical protein [Paenibacillus soyae]